MSAKRRKKTVERIKRDALAGAARRAAAGSAGYSFAGHATVFVEGKAVPLRLSGFQLPSLDTEAGE